MWEIDCIKKQKPKEKRKLGGSREKVREQKTKQNTTHTKTLSMYEIRTGP